MGALGLLGATLPAEYGGAGLNYVCYGLIAREIERVDSGLSLDDERAELARDVSDLHVRLRGAAQEIPAEARDRRMDRLLRPDRAQPRLRSGLDDHARARGAAAAIGSSGSKMWISNSPIADVFVVWAKTDDGAIRGFILEKGMKGLSAPKIEGKFSLRTSVTGEIVMDDVLRSAGKPAAERRGAQGPVRLPQQRALRHRLGRARRGGGRAGTRRANTRSIASSSAGRSPRTSSSRRSSPTCRPRSRSGCRAACGSGG